MADRPNNFGEVLLKAIGSTAEEAPSIFNNARTRKKAESLQMLNAMMQFQDAQREDQQLKMQQAQQQQQMAESNLRQQELQQRIQQNALEYEEKMAEHTMPMPLWLQKKREEEDKRKRLLAKQQLEDQLKLYQQYNMTKTGTSNLPKPPAGATSQQLSAAKAMDTALQGELSGARTAIAAQSGAKSPADLGALAQPADFNIFNLLTGQSGVNASDSANFAEYNRTFTSPFIDSTRNALETSHPDLYNIAAPILNGGETKRVSSIAPTKLIIGGKEYDAPKSRAEIEKIKKSKPNLYGILIHWADSVELK